MKIRNGFVSNSSSSSFLVFGNPAGIEDIEDPKLRIKDGCGGEGVYYFEPTKEMRDWIKNNPDDCPHMIIEHVCISDFVEMTVEEIKKLSERLNAIGKPCIAQIINADYHSPSELHEFLEDVIGE